VRIWVDRAFSAQSVPDLKKGITRVGDRIQNGTPFDLQGAVWVQDRQTRALGNLKSGASATIPARALEKTVGAELPGAIGRASQIETLFKGQTQQNGIPERTLRAALGEGLGNQNEGALLIAWSKNTVAPISIGANAAESSDLTLWVFRAEAFAPARAKTKIAGREAIVTLISNEPVAPQISGALGGGTVYYECLLPDAPKFRLEARGVGANAMAPFRQIPSFGGMRAPEFAPQATLPTFEVYDIEKNAWRPLKGTSRRDKSPAGGWNFSANLGKELAREPDRMLKIRVRRDNDRARVSSLKITVF
jgi:hypothetical protein